MTARRRLTVVPDPAPAATVEDLDAGQLAYWLRRMTDTSRDLCDAIDRYMGPEHPAPRPKLTVIRGEGDDK
jgi:hypothetical protein